MRATRDGVCNPPRVDLPPRLRGSGGHPLRSSTGRRSPWSTDASSPDGDSTTRHGGSDTRRAVGWPVERQHTDPDEEQHDRDDGELQERAEDGELIGVAHDADDLGLVLADRAVGATGGRGGTANRRVSRGPARPAATVVRAGPLVAGRRCDGGRRRGAARRRRSPRRTARPSPGRRPWRRDGAGGRGLGTRAGFSSRLASDETPRTRYGLGRRAELLEDTHRASGQVGQSAGAGPSGGTSPSSTSASPRRSRSRRHAARARSPSVRPHAREAERRARLDVVEQRRCHVNVAGPIGAGPLEERLPVREPRLVRPISEAVTVSSTGTPINLSEAAK